MKGRLVRDMTRLNQTRKSACHLGLGVNSDSIIDDAVRMLELAGRVIRDLGVFFKTVFIISDVVIKTCYSVSFRR